MQVSVEKISKIERRMTVTVPASQVEEAFDRQIKLVAEKANIQGFRPGKAPLNVIKQRFGNEARSEALGEVIQQSLYKALAEQNLKPVSMPKIEPKTTGLNEQPLEYVASFEVLPEIENINLKLDTLEKLEVEVTDQDLERVIEQLRKQYAKWQVVDRPAQEKDRVVISYEEKDDANNKASDFPVELGSKTMIPGFEEGLLGLKAGDQKTLKLKFPEDYGHKEKAGKAAEFNITVKQVYHGEVPDLTEEFVKKLGVASGQLEDLKKQIRQSLEQERDRLVKEKVNEQVFKLLLEQNPIDVPKSMVEREAKNIHDEIYSYQHDHHNHSANEMTAFDEMAKKRVALGLLVSEYAKKHELKADDARVQARIKEIAAAYEHPQEVIAWLSADERRQGIEAQILEDQVLDKLIAGTPTQIKKISYAELKGIRI